MGSVEVPRGPTQLREQPGRRCGGRGGSLGGRRKNRMDKVNENRKVLKKQLRRFGISALVTLAGYMIKRVKKSASPIRTWLGGDCWVPIALRRNESTMMIRVKLVRDRRPGVHHERAQTRVPDRFFDLPPVPYHRHGGLKHPDVDGYGTPRIPCRRKAASFLKR